MIKIREITTSELFLWLILPSLNEFAEAASNKSPSGCPISPDQTRPASQPSPGHSQPLMAGGLVCLLNFANVTQQPLEEECYGQISRLFLRMPVQRSVPPSIRLALSLRLILFESKFVPDFTQFEPICGGRQ